MEQSRPGSSRRSSSGLSEIFHANGYWGTTRLALDVLYTRFVFPRARILRRPAFIRGASRISVGAGFTVGRGLRMDAFGARRGPTLIEIGADVQLNDYVHIAAIESVSIGNRVLIASRVFISDHNHGPEKKAGPHSDPTLPPYQPPLQSASVAIEDDVCIGESVSILPGVRIGKGSIIGTMSSVTRDVPEFCIPTGNPARILKRYNFARSQWERV
jgi:acetyltransferase-like isoleucine patch superfamily enzyme